MDEIMNKSYKYIKTIKIDLKTGIENNFIRFLTSTENKLYTV